MMNTWRFIAATSICVLLIGQEIQSWILAASILFILWKCAIEYFRLAKPSRWLTNSLTVISLALILMQYRTLMSQEASAGFLVLLTSLKLLEERTLRDQMFLLLLGFVLISSTLLFSLELPYLIGGLVSIYLLWSAQNKNISYRATFLRALPIAVLLFLLFPRVQNPFGLRGYSQDSMGQTGFSDELNPGSISKIQSTRELAFRVQFLNQKLRPQTTEQYWRGQVLSLSEGLRWTLNPRTQRDSKFEKIQSPDYEVTLEPQNKRWIFVYDPSNSVQANEAGFVLKNNAYFEAVAPVRERLVYQGRIGELNTTAALEKIYLQTPSVSDALKKFVADLRALHKTNESFAEGLLDYYRAENFTYSKSPGTGSNNLDSFFFTNKKGYCEHYAATTATLLRLAQIPARVVTGYQGGEYNLYGKFWKFTQADAHAWVEYLNDQNQWQRLDPTSVVAPERLELGGALFEDLPEEWIGQNRAQDFLRTRQAWWIQAKDFISLSIDSLNYDLVVFLLDFNIERQRELASLYGRWIALFAIVVLTPFVFGSFLRRRKVSVAEWLQDELEKKAAQQKIYRQKSETMRHFVDRWGAQTPKGADTLKELGEAYEELEYARVKSNHTKSSLKEKLNSL